MSKEKYYVNNEELYNDIVKFRKKLEAWEAAGGEQSGLKEPPVPNSIGSAIIKIANKYSYSPNFINYSYIDEMISDGIEACVFGIRKFDYNNWYNPFAYFTQCCFYAFINRIKKEKKQTLIKAEIIKEIGADAFDLQDQDLDEDFKNSYVEFLRTHMNIDDSFLKKKKKAEEVVPDASALTEFLD